MIFLCFVETRTSVVDYMEPMPVDTLDEARVQARRMMLDQQAPIAAHIFAGSKCLETLHP